MENDSNDSCNCTEDIDRKVREVIEEMTKPICAEVSATCEAKMWKDACKYMEYRMSTCADRLSKIFE